VFLLALNLGAVAGSLVSAWGGVRFGPVRSAVLACLAASVGLLVLIGSPGTAVSYAALVLAGVGTHGTQCLIIAAVASHYRPRCAARRWAWRSGWGASARWPHPKSAGCC
jgi:AAHS family benzoate transporter-like MFS transporter